LLPKTPGKISIPMVNAKFRKKRKIQKLKRAAPKLAPEPYAEEQKGPALKGFENKVCNSIKSHPNKMPIHFPTFNMASKKPWGFL